MQLRTKFKTLSWIVFVLWVALVVSSAGNFWLLQKSKLSPLVGSANSSLANPVRKAISNGAKPVSAEEIYPLFECPCCGRSIDQCACPMAKERKSYIDVLMEVGQKMTRDEIVLAYVKKYGLSSFVDEEKGKEYRQKLVSTVPADRPIISLTPDSYDFGDVSQKKGTVMTFFEIKNEGKNDLIIKKLETSCGCTSASVVFQEKEGPRFGMNMGQKIPKWQIVIPSGQTAKLKVYYDPNFHKKFKGAAIRTITVFSNDPIDFQKKVQIELNQVD